MLFKAPDFWWLKKGFCSYGLAPIAYIYAYFSKRNFNKSKIKSVQLPVLCIGNYTLGGNGKTPLSIAMARKAKSLGLHPAIISRGYRGNYKAMHIVDVDVDSALLVGDEALLLAKHATTVVTKDRAIAAEFLRKLGYNFLILDDGFQSRKLYYDYAMIVLDANRGLGNKCIFPSGPLRAPLDLQLAYSDIVVNIGEKDIVESQTTTVQARLLSRIISTGPIKQGSLFGVELFSFCAIGDSNKFYNSIMQLGGNIIDRLAFADHHFFSALELNSIWLKAEAKNLQLITTQKDYMRLINNENLQKTWSAKCSYREFLESLIVLDIDIEFVDSKMPEKIIMQVLEKYKQRLGKSAQL
ncbi:tetraacyldisaccharide 4'-kinase [Bartonella sp. TP]|uniref:tetraacyldisaccharide 4'-kinase n=1 Tax=Bartonella sp. TP TaxID=3057550 RepID=UPI0025B0F9CF|nr:tetraacyldisaccharide 4'-kinase [Bartonella sp. TP]MDN5249631.1 tetraacyldisaccharide 4'-kinase [Alphaproteobacteria bacterium]WJW80348.1 tetraacyldisaccharide 4'-kinase [Bartonella sp. TP]